MNTAGPPARGHKATLLPADPATHRPNAVAQSQSRRQYPEIVFWLLLLGSWQFLSAEGGRNGVIGVCGAILFLLFAKRKLGELRAMGFEHAAWLTPPRGAWSGAAFSGVAIGLAIYSVGVWSGSNMRIAAHWKLILLQVSLGPVVEEIIFRGYLFALLGFVFRGIRSAKIATISIVGTAAALFSIVHVAQPGGSWLQFWCIGATGTLYGAVRVQSRSVASAAMAHAAYNLTLHTVSWMCRFIC